MEGGKACRCHAGGTRHGCERFLDSEAFEVGISRMLDLACSKISESRHDQDSMELRFVLSKSYPVSLLHMHLSSGWDLHSLHTKTFHLPFRMSSLRLHICLSFSFQSTLFTPHFPTSLSTTSEKWWIYPHIQPHSAPPLARGKHVSSQF